MAFLKQSVGCSCALMSSVVAGSALAAADPQRLTVVAAIEDRWTAPATFTSGPGDLPDRVETWQQLAEVRLFHRPWRGVRVGLGLGWERESIAHTRSSGLTPGAAPADQLPPAVRALWLRLPAAVMGTPHWGLTTLTSFGSATAAGVAPAHDRRWAVQAGPVWVRDDDLVVSLLVNYATRIDRRASLFAFPAVEWRFAPAWQLTLVDELDGISRLTWRVAPAWAMGLRADVRFREYRVADDADQALADDQVALGSEATWYPQADDRGQVTVFAGASLRQQLTHYVDGDEVRREVAGPAAQAGVRVRLTF